MRGYDINTIAKEMNKKLQEVDSCWATYTEEEEYVGTPYVGTVDRTFDVHDILDDRTLPKVAASAQQIGGDHYRKLVIQPAEYTQKNNLTYLEGAVVKYISRYKSKNGIEDLDKAIHCIQLIKEIEYA